MIEKVGSFFNQSTTIVILGRDDCLGAFFSYFFENLVQSLIK